MPLVHKSRRRRAAYTVRAGYGIQQTHVRKRALGSPRLQHAQNPEKVRARRATAVKDKRPVALVPLRSRPIDFRFTGCAHEKKKARQPFSPCYVTRPGQDAGTKRGYYLYGTKCWAYSARGWFGLD